LRTSCSRSLLTLFLLATSLAASAPAAPVKLSEGATLRVRLLETLVSGSKKKGEEIRFETVDDVLGPQHEVLVAKGSPVSGTITRSSGRGMFGKPGKLEFTIDRAHAIDGTKISLRATESKSGRNNSGAAITTAVLLFVPALFIHGRDVKIEPGKEFVVFVNDDAMIDPEKKPDSVAAPGKTLTFTLKNGDKITGTMDGFADGIYTITTKSGTVKVPASDVSLIVDK
jgi:hypothetical protein